MSAPLVEPYPASREPLASPRAPGPASSAALGAPALGWLREPLLHFLLLGGILFAVDHVLVSRAGDPRTMRTIVVGADVDSEAIETFRAARGREPNAEELDALHRVWLDNEVLYREGLALQVDKGDPAIRERVIFKALSVIDSNVKVPPADDTTLRTWFEAHREKYDEPARYDFEEAALSGDTSEAAVREFVTALNGGVPGDAKAGLRVFKGRPRANIVDSYGADLAKALEDGQRGTWYALHTRDGWRAMRLNALTPPKRAAFEALRGIVLHDWTDAVAAEQRTDAVRALAKKYKVVYGESK